MSQGDSPVVRVTRALAENGFVFRERNDYWLTFSGSLTVEGATHAISLTVHAEGRELPVVVLEQVPEKLQPVAPHLGNTGRLCYAAAGSIVLDVFDIAGQTLSCVRRASEVLSSLLRGEMMADLEEEFFAYWGDDICFLDLSNSSNDVVECLVIERGDTGNLLLAVTNDKSRTLERLNAIGMQSRKNVCLAVRRIKTHTKPRPLLGKWPPRTVSDVLNWQGVLDSQSRRKLDAHITEAYKAGAPGVVCLVESPNMPYAFIVRFATPTKEPGKRHALNARETVYKASVSPMACYRIDDEYIAKRNSPTMATLAKRKIALIGCGTIGGFLGELLLKAGAGSDGGKLALVDNDILLPQNVGRHRLGFNSVLKNKALALGEELRRNAPGAIVEGFPVDAMQADLHAYDIVVNATGEEAIGHLLTAKLKGECFIPMLTVWVEGPGTAVRALLRDKPIAACTRCLGSLARQPLYPTVEGGVPVLLAGQGCESLYVPFPATASVQAACLAADMLVEWAGGTTTPRLQTRVLDAHYRKGADDQDPQTQPGCPACGS